MATWNMNNSRKVGACWLFFNEVLARPSSCPVCVSSSNLTHTSGCRDDVPLLHSKHETNPITHCSILFSVFSPFLSFLLVFLSFLLIQIGSILYNFPITCTFSHIYGYIPLEISKECFKIPNHLKEFQSQSVNQH